MFQRTHLEAVLPPTDRLVWQEVIDGERPHSAFVNPLIAQLLLSSSKFFSSHFGATCGSIASGKVGVFLQASTHDPCHVHLHCVHTLQPVHLPVVEVLNLDSYERRNRPDGSRRICRIVRAVSTTYGHMK